MAIGAAHVGMFGAAKLEGASRELLTAIGRASEWLNSPRLTPKLPGKVVLVQFCTYTWINWLRTLPNVRASGHRSTVCGSSSSACTPEFAFEHEGENVRRARWSR